MPFSNKKKTKERFLKSMSTRTNPRGIMTCLFCSVCNPLPPRYIFVCYCSPLPNMSTFAILISPRKPPQNTKLGSPKWISRNCPDWGSLWKLYRKPEFSGISRPIPILDFGAPIFSVLGGGHEVDLLGSAELLLWNESHTISARGCWVPGTLVRM